MLEYVERKLGHTPRAALERIRVAFALAELPAIACAMEQGELPFSAVRELARVATPETEQVWLGAAVGKTVHEIEKLVSGHTRGDLPTDAPDPSTITKVLRFDVKPSTAALIKAAKRAIEQQRGMKLDDDAFLAALAGIAIEGVPADDETKISRAKFQVAVTRCDDCNRGWSDVAGVAAPMDAAELARASCDAQHLGRVDTDTPARAHQDVAPAVRRLVWRRDRGKCVVPGCRATAYLEIHHVRAREDGGSHEPKNLTLLCDGHHSALHRGSLTIRGEAPDRLVFDHRLETHVGSSQFDRATMRVDAKRALVGLGFKSGVAAAAIDAAVRELSTDVALEQLVRAALQHCPRPAAP